MRLIYLYKTVRDVHRRCEETRSLVQRARHQSLPRSRALVRTARERLHRGELLRPIDSVSA